MTAPQIFFFAKPLTMKILANSSKLDVPCEPQADKPSQQLQQQKILDPGNITNCALHVFFFFLKLNK